MGVSVVVVVEVVILMGVSVVVVVVDVVIVVVVCAVEYSSFPFPKGSSVIVAVIVVVVVEYSFGPFQKGSKWLFPTGIGISSKRRKSQHVPLVGFTRSESLPEQLLAFGIEICWGEKIK
jgi:hypothetical protein